MLKPNIDHILNLGILFLVNNRFLQFLNFSNFVNPDFRNFGDVTFILKSLRVNTQ